MVLLEDYFRLQQQYQGNYGERTVVVYQKGSHYNMYEYDPRLDESGDISHGYTERIGHAVHLSFSLNLELTQINKNKAYSFRNPNMIGFPYIAYEKYRDALLAREFTVIRVDQYGEGKNVPRAVAEVISPGTEFERNAGLPASNHIASIYIEYQSSPLHNSLNSQMLIIGGVSSIDVSTGKNIVGEAYSRKNDDIHALQEIYRFLLTQQPREILIHLGGFPPEQIKSYQRFLEETLELNEYTTVLIKVDDLNPEYFKLEYQRQFLSKIFHPPDVQLPTQIAKLNIEGVSINKVSNSSIISELGLERLRYGLISYIALLQYCYEHNEAIIQKIQEPDTTWIDEKQHLVLTHNAINQLNICPPTRSAKWKQFFSLPNKSVDSLISVVDQTSTSLGRRYLETRILNPITDPKELQQSYNMTEELIAMESDHGFMSTIETKLRGLPDIERYQRKLTISVITPKELAILFRAYIKLVDIYMAISSSSAIHLKQLLFNKEEINDFNSCLQEVLSLVDLDKLSLSYIIRKKIGDKSTVIEFDEPFIHPDRDATLDEQWSKVVLYRERLTAIYQHLNSFLIGSRGKLIELQIPMMKSKGRTKTDDEGETTGIGLFTTKAKTDKLARHASQIKTELCGTLRFLPAKAGKKIISSEVIDQCCQGLEQVKIYLRQYLYSRYQQILAMINQHRFFPAAIQFISMLDFIKSNAKAAIRFNYFKPSLIDNPRHSQLEMKGLRHPIIERLLESEYIPNDLSLGKEPLGMLLYGCNASGKSSLTKAIALCIVMAQAGCFTPCQLTYRPYHKIITRLSGNDDIFKGQSSFIVEMNELRTILRNTDEYTLVIGDELCRGTEINSATGLTIATILTLLERRCSFVFSTHQHHLVKRKQIQEIDGKQLRVCHLTIKYDESSNLLIFGRKLKGGPGDTIYGLEVARSLHLDSKFIALANQLRREELGINTELLSSKKSHFNSKVYVDSCASCGKNLAAEKLDTHHIREQHEADERGLIGHIPKDAKYNLVVLCKDCHTKLHQNKQKIISNQTINGLSLSVDNT